MVERNRVLISFGSYSVVWLRGTGFSSRSVLMSYRVVERNRVLISFGSYSVVWLRGTSSRSVRIVWLRGTGFSSRSVRILSCG